VGHNLRQALLSEQIYGGSSAGRARRGAGYTLSPLPPLPRSGERDIPRIVVVGAGLAGLTAALLCAEADAKVELIAQGQGALTLHPGWIEPATWTN